MGFPECLNTTLTELDIIMGFPECLDTTLTELDIIMAFPECLDTTFNWTGHIIAFPECLDTTFNWTGHYYGLSWVLRYHFFDWIELDKALFIFAVVVLCGFVGLFVLGGVACTYVSHY